MSARLFAVLAFAMLAAACGRKDTGQPLYQSVAVERRDIDVKVEASGVIQPVNTVELKSKASGEILKLGADVGDRVQQGARLVSIDPRTPRNRVAQADAQLAATKSRLKTAEAQLARGDKLLGSKWINQADYDKLALDVANAKSEVIAAQVALENARIALDDTELRAPITGTIISRKVSEGQVISSPISDFGGGTLLLTMADLARVQVRAQVDETDIGKIRPGMPVQVTVAAYPGRPFTGEVEKIEPQAIVDQNVTMFNVLVSIENRDGLLMPGMNADVKLAVAHAGSVLTIPVTALRVDRDVATTAPVLGITEEELREQLKPKQPATAASAPAAPAAPQTMTLPTGRTIELPPGVDAAQVRAAMAKRRAGQELNEQEQQLLRSVFRGMGGGAGGGMGGGSGGGVAGTTVRLSGEYWVVIDRNGKYAVAPVRTGLTDLDRVEIVSGLTEKDKVLLLPSSSLVEVQEQLQKFVSGRFGSLPGMQRRQEN